MLALGNLGLRMGRQGAPKSGGVALIDDLVAWWAMEDAADSHGSNDLSNSGVSFGTGKVNNAGDFNDDSSLTISSAGTGSLRPGTSDFSISVWMYNRSYPEAYNPILFFGAGSVGQPGFTVAHRDTGRLYFFLSDGTSRNDLTFDTLSLDTWYHLVINVDRDGSVTLYVNGSPVASGAPPDQGSPVDLQPTVDWTFGNGFIGYWDGLIDEVGYWHRLLTPEEIAKLYNGGDGITYGDFA